MVCWSWSFPTKTLKLKSKPDGRSIEGGFTGIFVFHGYIGFTDVEEIAAANKEFEIFGDCKEVIRAFQGAANEFLRVDVGIGNYAERAYTFLGRLIPNEFIAFGTLHLQDMRLDIGANRALPRFDEAMEGLGSVMTDYELFNWDPSVNRGKPFMKRDFFTEREFRQSAPYNLTLKLLGVDNHCAIHVPGGQEEISFFGIERNGGPDYSEEERNLLALAQPLLGSARQLALERRHILSREAKPAALVRRGLTNREADILTLVARGDTNAEIAVQLLVSIDTVKEYLSRIFRKTRTRNRLAAALWALKITERDRTRSTIGYLLRVVVPVLSDK